MIRRSGALWSLAVAAGFLCACDRQVMPVHPPVQFVMPPGADPEPEIRMLTMGGLDAKLDVMEGVDGAGSGDDRKWTADKARFRFQLASVAGLDFDMRYSVNEVTFRQTGPVRITVSVDGRTFDSFVRKAPGDYEYRHAADQQGLPLHQPFEVSIMIDPPYVAPDDGAKLGLLLTSIGFVDRTAVPAHP